MMKKEVKRERGKEVRWEKFQKSHNYLKLDIPLAFRNSEQLETLCNYSFWEPIVKDLNGLKCLEVGVKK